jgi:hypothetical protein
VRLRRLHAIGGLRDAEVRDTGEPVASEQDVVRADVPMNDPEVLAAVVVEDVRGLEAGERVEPDPGADARVDRPADRRQLAADLGERSALDVVEDDEGLAAVKAELANLHDIVVLDGRGEARLVDEHREIRLVLR